MENANKPKPIFEPRDFDCEHDMCGMECIANLANTKLSSLGIDAETPEKIAELKRRAVTAELWKSRCDTAMERAVKSQDRVEQLEASVVARTTENLMIKQRLAELERQIAEAPKVYGANGKWVEYGIVGPWPKHKAVARLVNIEELK